VTTERGTAVGDLSESSSRRAGRFERMRELAFGIGRGTEAGAANQGQGQGVERG
jgi:hypothetical protein